MPEHPKHNFIVIVWQSLGWPLLWGLGASTAFYALIHHGLIDSALLRRYCAGHPVEYAETGMFFVGLASLVITALGVLAQYGNLPRIRLAAAPQGGESAEVAPRLLESLSELPSNARRSYLAKRLHNALEYVARKGSADHLDEELKYLADLDAVRQQEGYALVRITIWAIPMLGFLGTIIGITVALGDLTPKTLVNSPEQAMQGLLAGLGIAFDTTALGLSLAVVLMFGQFMANQLETELLTTVDARVTEELVVRFEELGARTDPELASVRRMTDAVVRATEKLVYRQVDIWQQSMQAANERWQQVMSGAQVQLESALAHALKQSTHEHAVQLSKNAEVLQQQAQRQTEILVHALADNARVMSSQQSELAKQGDVMLRVIRATGEIVQLEKSLNQNLQALAGAKNFEETVMSLSAAIHLLTSRTSGKDVPRPVSLETSRSEGRAA